MTVSARPSALAAALTLTVGLTLAGCGGSDSAGSSDSKDSSSAGVKPATGDTISTSSFSYTAPQGWTKSTRAGLESLAVATGDTDGFADNLNVIKRSIGSSDLDQIEDAVTKELATAGVTDVRVLDRDQVDGEKAIHVTGGLSTNGVKDVLDQYTAVHDGNAYITTFSFSPDVSQSDRTKLSRSVLTTWKWAG